MATLSTARIEDHFGDVTDPRRREGVYPLTNIVVMALCAVISGADDFVAIARWAEAKKDWLAKFLDLSAGIPSHDRFNAIFRALQPAEFETCLLSWVAALHETTAGQVIAIDGKTLWAQLRRRQRQSGHSHGQRVGHGQFPQLGPGGRRREEQRDHGDPQVAGHPRRFRPLW